jgi:predicted DNA-binding transcriptional regulator AlpA
MKSTELTISQLVQDVKTAQTKKKVAPVAQWDINSKAESLHTQQLLRINELSQLTTLSKSCINLWVAQGKFPPPITFSATVKVWVLQDVLDFIESQRGSK